MMAQFKNWFKLAKAHPKVSIGIAIAVLVIFFAVF